MKAYYLPKGTVIKHGTSLLRAEKILVEGFKSVDREGRRKQLEAEPEQQGVYAGELIAYFGAFAAYTAEINDLSHQEIFKNASKYFSESPTKLRTLKLDSIPCTLPVVLRIELGEDCELYADEDFVYDGKYPENEKVPVTILRSEAEGVWLKWKSGVIKTKIRKEWIKEIEYPTLHKLGPFKDQKKSWIDCEFFAGGLLQSSHQVNSDYLSHLYTNYGRSSLSNIVPATLKAIDKIKKSKGFYSKADQLYNYMAIARMMDALAARHGIKFA